MEKNQNCVTLYRQLYNLHKNRRNQIGNTHKDELDRKIMMEFSTLKPKAQSYLTHGNEENKKGKGTKSVS